MGGIPKAFTNIRIINDNANSNSRVESWDWSNKKWCSIICVIPASNLHKIHSFLCQMAVRYMQTANSS